MSEIVQILAALGGAGLGVGIIAFVRIWLIKEDMREAVIAKQTDLITHVMTERQAQRHGYPAPELRTVNEILDPGSHPEPIDRQAQREFEEAWLAPNEEFIRETDEILNNLEWERIYSPAIEAGGADDRWEQSA